MEESPSSAHTPEHRSIQGMTVTSTRFFGRCLSRLGPCNWWWSCKKCLISVSCCVPGGRNDLLQGVWRRIVGVWKSPGRSMSFQSCISLCTDNCSNTIMQKWELNASEFVLIIQQLCAMKDKGKTDVKVEKTLDSFPAWPRQGEGCGPRALVAWCIMSGRSSQRSLVLCRCEYLPLPGSPGSAQHNTSGICTRIWSFC